MGTPMWNMHAPWEIVSANYCWQTYRAYSAYLRS
jgi:aspartyl aminopeptidase